MFHDMAPNRDSKALLGGAMSRPDSEEVDAQLERIVGSADFDVTTRTQKFLRFIVQQVMAGNVEEISQYSIATQVFERNGSFDSSADPIVRIQAGRLRRSLEHYYLTTGAADPVRIEVPKGTYVPTFNYQSDRLAVPGSADLLAEANAWPAVLVTPFRNLTGDPGRDYLCQGLATELGIELDRYQIVRVYMPTASDQSSALLYKDAGARFKFIIEGSIEKRAGSLGILVRLLDATTGVQIWGRPFRCSLGDPEFSTFLDEVAMSVAAALAAERGVIMRHLVRERDPKSSLRGGSHDAILRFYHFNVSPSLEGFHTVSAALRKATESDPDRGLLWSLLARMYAVNYSLELVPDHRSIDDAYDYARNGVRLEPDSQRTRGVLAFVHLLRDELEAGRREVESALSLNPNSMAFVDALGYLLILLGDWDRGVALTWKAMRLNPFHQPSTHFALWLNHLRLEEGELACQQALAAGDTGGFWAPLARASSFGIIGKIDEARAEVGRLLAMKPDFPERSNWLVTRYVKFPELVERILSNLHFPDSSPGRR